MRFKFANYTFDSNTGLRYCGQAVHLPPKEKGLLELLLTERGQVVRKDVLIEKVWAGTDVSDESISRTVYRLRVAMQSSGGPEVVGAGQHRLRHFHVGTGHEHRQHGAARHCGFLV